MCPATSRPPTQADPDVGATIPVKTEINVVLPAHQWAMHDTMWGLHPNIKAQNIPCAQPTVLPTH